MGVFPTVSRIVSTIRGGPGAFAACGGVRDSVSDVFFGIISGLGVGTRDAKSYDATVPGDLGQGGNCGGGTLRRRRYGPVGSGGSGAATTGRWAPISARLRCAPAPRRNRRAW